MINGKLVEIKGDHFIKPDGTHFYPFTKKKENGEWIEMSPEEKAYWDDLYERRHQCGLQHGVEFWQQSDCQPYINYCNVVFPGWDKLFLTNNPLNPSNVTFVYYITKCAQKYTPFNTDLSKEYTEPVGKGITPFDLGLGKK
jgi:hypothetical protein